MQNTLKIKDSSGSLHTDLHVREYLHTIHTYSSLSVCELDHIYRQMTLIKLIFVSLDDEKKKQLQVSSMFLFVSSFPQTELCVISGYFPV